MEKSEIVALLERHVAGKLLGQPSRRIASDEPLISSGLVSSLQLVDIALYVEDAFGVRLDDTELTASVFDTLQQLAELISARRSTA